MNKRNQSFVSNKKGGNAKISQNIVNYFREDEGIKIWEFFKEIISRKNQNDE